MISSIPPGISALKAYGKRIGTMANNIANVDTKGFKKSSSSTSSLSPTQVTTASGTAQVGRGALLENIAQSYQQGMFEPTSEPTHMGIGGDGFFIVKTPEGGNYYTRDGEFQFDKAGRLVNSNGYVLQGWQLDADTGERYGGLVDMAVTNFSASPQESRVIKNIVNLDADETDHSGETQSLSSMWHGNAENGTYIDDKAYAYQSPVQITDSIGASHDATFYFDRTAAEDTWEFIATVNPLEDQRAGVTADNRGLLARGTLTFDDYGEIKSMTMEINDGTGNWVTQNGETDITNGHFTVHPDFQGAADGSTAMSIEVDFGASLQNGHWINDSLSSTQYASASSTLFKSADGFGAGDFLGVSVSAEGVVTGHYNNGENIPLFQVALAKFNDQQGLNKIGSNLYTSSRDSGEAITAPPGVNGLGSIAPNSIEQSNVDIAEEFVHMITFQRGYQANLKAIQVDNDLKGDVLNIIS